MAIPEHSLSAALQLGTSLVSLLTSEDRDTWGKYTGPGEQDCSMHRKRCSRPQLMSDVLKFFASFGWGGALDAARCLRESDGRDLPMWSISRYPISAFSEHFSSLR
eukprot:1391473-Amorphochlora_amoeboformis.AAC.1